MKYKSIVFSGLPGAGKSTLVEELSRKYTLPVHSVGALWRKKHELLYPNHEVSLEEFSRNATNEERNQINFEARDIFSKSRAVGDSRYTIYLRGAAVLLVFLTADIKVRAARAVGLEKYKGKSQSEIEQILAEREQIDLEVGRILYNYDYRDPNCYDLVVNTGTVNLADEAKLISSIFCENQ